MINTYADFITQIESVYGKYIPALKAELIAYLPKKIKESDLQDVYWKLREEYSTVYKTPPDLTQINNLFKLSDKDYEAEALNWWGMITRTGNSLDDVIISDLRAQAAIEDFGGWAAFCQRDPESEHFHQAKFIKWFVMYSHNRPEREQRVLRGESTRVKIPIMFGDKEACLQLVQDRNVKQLEAMKEINNIAGGFKKW